VNEPRAEKRDRSNFRCSARAEGTITLEPHDGSAAAGEPTGAKLEFLPPYSPDLNPIEMVFSKIKQLLRTLACRTRDALWRSMQSVLDTITPADASNCFRHCGYTLQGD